MELGVTMALLTVTDTLGVEMELDVTMVLLTVTMELQGDVQLQSGKFRYPFTLKTRHVETIPEFLYNAQFKPSFMT